MKQVYKFSATWCQPCKTLTNWLASKGITLPEYDIDNPDTKPLLQRFGVRSVPTVVIDEDGFITTFVGTDQKEKLLEAIK